MSQKQLAFPTTLQRATKPQLLKQSQFDGMNEDDPASEIGANEVVRLVNLIAYGNRLSARKGCEKLTDEELPKLKDANGDDILITAEKEGTNIILNNPGDDQYLEVGDYLVWADGSFDQLTANPDSGEWTSLVSEDRPSDTCKIAQQVFGAFYHDKSKIIYLHIGNKLYKTSTVSWGYSEVVYAGELNEGLGRSQTRFRPSDDDVIAFNDSGIFRIVKDKPFNHYFQINIDAPSRAFDSVEETDKKTYGRQGTYSFSRIVGGDFNEGRTGVGNSLLQETAPVTADEITGIDTGKVFTILPVGLGSELAYTIKSANKATHVSNSAAIWAATGVGADGTTAGFKVKFNGEEANIIPDFSLVETMFDVALAIQDALRLSFSTATCKYAITKNGYPQLSMTPGQNGTIEEVVTGEYVTTPDSVSVGVNELDDLTGQIGGLSVNQLYMNDADTTDPILSQTRAAHPLDWSEVEINSDTAAMTHVTLWSTTDNGPAGIALNNNTEKFVWAKDVPLIRPVTVTWNNETKQLIAGVSDGYLYQDDVSSTIKCFDGTTTVISNLDLAEGTAGDNWSEKSKYAAVASYRAAGNIVVGPMAIGANKVGKASQSGNTLTIDTTTTGTVDAVPTGSPYEFKESDVGKIIFLEDGTLRHIAKYIDANTVEVYETGDFTDLAAGWDYITGAGIRNIRDNITDAILKNRGNNDLYVMQTRFYAPMPSSQIGEIANNFLFVAESNSSVLHYCAVPLGKKNRLGFYHPGYQRDENSENIITYIKRYSDRIICFCRRSTYGTSMSTVNSIDEPTIGEKIFILPHMALVQNIGLVQTGSLQDIGIGQSVMITNEPAVRVFNGTQYGAVNLSRGIMDYIRNISPIVYTSYDPEGGYRIYCSLYETSHTVNKINPETGFCLRIDLSEIGGQGKGWSIFRGPKMVMPMPYTEGLNTQGEKDYLQQAILDERTGKWYWVSTYDGPAGSGLEEAWTDKDDTEIVSSVITREDVGNPESYQLEFLVAHVHLRPDPSSVDEDGNPVFRDGQEVLVKIYNDGKVIYTAQTQDIPIPGDITFDRKAQGPRMQLEYQFATSQVDIISLDRVYASRDRAGNQSLASRSTNEMTYQREYGDQVLWLSRGPNPKINRSIGNEAIGAPAALITGPDGVERSAFDFDGSTEMAVETYQYLTGDFTIQLGYKK